MVEPPGGHEGALDDLALQDAVIAKFEAGFIKAPLAAKARVEEQLRSVPQIVRDRSVRYGQLEHYWCFLHDLRQVFLHGPIHSLAVYYIVYMLTGGGGKGSVTT